MGPTPCYLPQVDAMGRCERAEFYQSLKRLANAPENRPIFPKERIVFFSHQLFRCFGAFATMFFVSGVPGNISTKLLS